ncbi:MAG: NADH-quinone oxidoreductase subunit J [Nitrospira sp.]|nr:NADH-quinone oxidoreductase subunit J [Nitrospira sp.]
MAQLVFGYFAGVIAVAAVLVVALRNPVYSVLSLLVMFFHVAGLYITLHAEFLAAVQIIVYAGAILVLYLFVLMLLNSKQDDRYHRQWQMAVILCCPLFLELMVLFAGVDPGATDPLAAAPMNSGEDNTRAIGLTLFSTYLFPFEVASLILLVAMIGAIMLAKRDIGRQGA